MQPSDGKLGQVSLTDRHRMVVVENQIMDWSHQVLIRRHDDTGLMDRSASTPGSSSNYVGTWEAFDVNLPKMRGNELHEDNLFAKTMGGEGGLAQKARPEPENPKLEVGGEAEVDQPGEPHMCNCRAARQTSPATWTMPVPPEAHEAPRPERGEPVRS